MANIKMVLMVELFDKTFRAVIVKMLFEKIINTMETNEKMQSQQSRKLQQVNMIHDRILQPKI